MYFLDQPSQNKPNVSNAEANQLQIAEVSTPTNNVLVAVADTNKPVFQNLADPTLKERGNVFNLILFRDLYSKFIYIFCFFYR